MTMTQRIPLRIRNDSSRALMIEMPDRPIEIKTTSLGAGANQLPPMSLLTGFIGDDDILVITPDGIKIVKEEEPNE